MNRIDSFKGFTVPKGYTLRITKPDGSVLEKIEGEQSGGEYSIEDVTSGVNPNWQLTGNPEAPAKSPINTHQEVYDIANSVRGLGGDMVFIGGLVRDYQLGNTQSKDVDIEVYNLDADTLISVLSNYGKVDTVGASFGVIKLTTESGDYDFSLPRRENKQGEGHRGFIVEADHTMTKEEAVSRRDFTFNGLMMTIEGEVVDLVNGIADLKEKRLRHISDKFAEDPLRVLRGFQFAARFNMTMDADTAKMSESLKNEYHTIAKERIWGEWNKWALRGTKPSAGLEVLRQTGWIDFYPELKSLVGVQQDKQWHPEGDVWVHTKHVTDEAVRIADRDGLEGDDRIVLIFAALCHDLGKPATTVHEDGRWRAPAHPQEGVQPTRDFLRNIGMPEGLVQRIWPLVAEHMAHLNDITPRSIRRLALRLDPSNVEMLSKVIEADHSGRPPLPKELPKAAKDMVRMAQQLRFEGKKPTPIIGGRHLMQLAVDGEIPEEYKKGGPHFSHLLNSMFEAQLDGSFEDEASGIFYLKRIFSLEYKNAIFFTGSLNREQKNRLLDYVKESGLDMEDVWAQGEGFIRKLVE